MINAAVIVEAMKDLLTAGLPATYKIERSEYKNMDFEENPWVGVYKGDLDYGIATLGGGTLRWKAEFKIIILIQSSNLMASAENADNDMEGYIKAILDIISADRNVSQSVDAITGISVRYAYDQAESEEMYFLTSQLEITTEVRTQ